MNSVQESRSRHSTQWPMAAGSCNGIHPRLSCLRSLWEGFLAITHGAYGYSNRTLEEVASYRTWDSFAAKKCGQIQPAWQWPQVIYAAVEGHSLGTHPIVP